jgi:nucleoside recognition membrane protein YjiH
METSVSRKWLLFLIPSIIGAAVFLVPFPYKDSLNIGLGVLMDLWKSVLGDYLPLLALLVLIVSMVLSIVGFMKKDLFKSDFLKHVFVVSSASLIIRILSALLCLVVFLEIGPEFIWSGDTGGLMLYLLTVLLGFFFFASFLLPLLLDFGMMEFFGTLIRPAIRPLYKVPGRASIDILASWLGSAPVGIMVTNLQYTSGYYTGREAAIISTQFSVISLPIVFVFAGFLNLDTMFPVFYGSVIAVALVANFIMVRIPPLSKKADDYYPEAGAQIAEDVPSDKSIFQWAIDKALEKAAQFKSAKDPFNKGLGIITDLWFGLLPLVMLLGTIALIVAEFTPFFNILTSRAFYNYDSK